MSRFLNLFGMKLADKMPGPGAQNGDHSAAPAELGWGPLEQAGDGTVLLDEQGRITEANSRALELLHCALPALFGLDFWEAVPEEITEQHQSATGQALTFAARHAFVAHDKFEDKWVRYAFTRQSPGYVVSLRDVSSTQRLLDVLEDSERYNQLIFEANPNPMWIFDDSSTRILAVNQAAVEFYGIARKKFLTLGMDALFPEGEGAALLDSLASGKGVREGQLELRLCQQQKADGQQVLVELACGPLSWNGQQAVFVSLADVSQRHLADGALRRVNAELEQELARCQSELGKARRDVAAFTRAVSHDLQGPLHAVNGFAKMLAKNYSTALDASGLHYVNRIQASTRQLAKLVDDLRTLVQLPELSGNPEKFDLVPVCRALVDDLRKREPGRNVAIEMDASLLLVGDKGLLATALACLLENAWKFTSKKAEGWIKVGLMPGSRRGELVLLVSDNGAGFDMAYSGKLFTAFQRLHSSADFPGNGLGLAIVKGVAALHGGKVWAETADQAGASFFMALPHAADSA